MTFHSLRFDRAASTYGAHAQIQAAMADELIGMSPDPESGSLDAAAMLEMGCGTGLLTLRLRRRFPASALLATDAAPRMLALAREAVAAQDAKAARASLPGPSPIPVRWHAFDASGEAEIPPAIRAAAPYALAASGAMVQWFPALDRHFRMAASLLERGGCYLVSGFTRANFPELNAILAEPPFAYPDYPGHDAAGIRAAAEAGGLAVEELREESVETALASPMALLECIRGLGSARRPEERKPLTRSRLRHLLDTYQERYACAGGVRATWKPWYARLRKA
jgi:SAM-dependent methyltransferase